MRTSENTHAFDLRPALMELIGSGLRQAEIAREIGLTRATVNSAVHGEGVWIPRYDTGKRLVDLLARTRKTRRPAKEPAHA